MDSKTLIIAGIAVALLVLGGIVATQANTHTQENTTAYVIPLKNADFKYFEMKTPVDSNFTIKNAMTNESDRGMIYWKNVGNFSKEIESVSINKNLTDRLVPQTMKLMSESNGTKIYSSDDGDNSVYQAVLTKNGTDIIITGRDLNIIDEMLNSTVVKNTNGITTPSAKTPEKTPVAKVVEQKKNVETTVDKKVEKTDSKPKIETTTDKPKQEVKKDTDLYIGGGSFKTGSERADKTYAKIYIGGENAGKDIILRIVYSRDGTNLNNGNMVPLTVDSSGYVEIYSADAYRYYPDNAYIELYDSNRNLIMTQNVALDPDSSTQYF